MTTLAQARQQVVDALDDGSTCPCCQQFAKRYKRKLYAAMARWLIWLVSQHRRNGGQWVDVNLDTAHEYRKGGGDFAKLAHWGLIQAKPNDDPDKRSSGLWRPTELGLGFVHGSVRVPTHVYLFNNEVSRFSDSEFGIEGALGEGFDWREVMGSSGLELVRRYAGGGEFRAPWVRRVQAPGGGQVELFGGGA